MSCFRRYLFYSVLCWFVLGGSIFSRAQTGASGIVPLDRLDSELRAHIEHAAADSWQMDLQDILVSRGEATSTRMSAARAFRLSANANVGYQQQDAGGVNSDGVNLRYNIAARKPLYHWGSNDADHEYGLLVLESSKHRRSLTFLNLYRSLVSSYADYVVLKQQEKDQLLSLEIFEADLKLLRDQVERGERPQSRLNEENVKYERSQLGYESLKIRLQKAENEFRTVAGLGDNAVISTKLELIPAPEDISLIENQVNGFIAQIETDSLLYEEKKFRLDQEDLRLHKYKVNNRPKVDGIVRFRKDTETIATGNRNNLDLEEAFAGIEMTWNIYDGGATRGFVRDTIQSKRQLERELRNLREEMATDLRFMLSDLKIIVQQCQLDEQDYSWSVGGYEQGLQDREAGRLSEKEIGVLRRGVEVQKTKAFISRARYYKALASIHVAMESSVILSYLD